MDDSDSHRPSLDAEPFVCCATPLAFDFLMNAIANDDGILADGDSLMLIAAQGSEQTGFALLKKDEHALNIEMCDGVMLDVLGQLAGSENYC